MSRDDVQRYFDALCDQSRLTMSSAERLLLRAERTRIATILAFWR